ncbi:hypothetical protein ABFS83_03G009500 [Erythranthe nasuta]
MEKIPYYFFFIAFALTFFINTSPICSATLTPLNSTTDQEALIAFKNSITLDPSGILANNWSTTINSTSSINICSWIGISCTTKHQRVTTLNISGFQISGKLPPQLVNLTFLRVFDVSSNGFTGEIPSWIGSLPRLEILDLNNNSFGGTVPKSLFDSSRLKSLDLSYNLLSGTIPKEIGNSNSSSLEELSLMFNHFHGRIPSGIGNLKMLKMLLLGVNDFNGGVPVEIGNLSRLEVLSIHGASLTGNIPSSIFNISSLIYLDLSNNSLSGSFPNIETFRGVSNIRRLFLHRNLLSGPIDSTLFESKNLVSLVLTSNRFTGNIPKQIGNITSLKYLYLDNNYFTGEFPKELANLGSLEFLTVRNNSLSGSIPSSIFNISTLRILDLSTNQFSGNLPSDIANFPGFNIQQLFLYYNALGGEIPTSISNASTLTILDMNSNSFTGFVPNFGNLRNLNFLDFWGNNLTSNDQEMSFITSLTSCQYLQVLDISFNPLNGFFPSSIGNLSTSLRIFRAFNSSIHGVIPPGIGNLSSLQYAHLSENKFIGSIPQTIGNLKQLQRLYLDENRLQGYISTDICETSKLGDLDLRGNSLIGPIPECLGELKSLRYLYLASNNLNSTIPTNLWNLVDILALNLSSNNLSGQISSQIGRFKSINQVDLSSNRFSGDIPISIDGCQSLETLSLSNNMFQGSIPQSFGNIKSLMRLDLSNNSLSGSIPNSLESLPFLRYFNVSYNKLEGEIPTKGAFVNFTANSFIENYALCGDETRFGVPPCINKNQGRLKSNNAVKLMKYIWPPFVSIILLATVVLTIVYTRRKPKKTPSPPIIALDFAWRIISYRELVKGTDSFNENNILGKGSFGTVFKGTLHDGLNIAVKVFNSQSERAVKSFDTESEILSSIRHRNLVRIIGCCSNTEFKALILEYMPNGSLEKWLYCSENRGLDLMQRLKIAIDVALALEYLHHYHTFPVVHCDIKPSNVLLDEDMVARVGDFGISKLFDHGEVAVQTKTIATIGYAAPEYGTEGKVSTKGDVYSYGVTLMEMFTGKRPTNEMFGGEMGLKEWVKEALQENKVSEIVANGLLEREDENYYAKEECISCVFYLAMKCLAFSPHERIDMVEIVAALHKIKAKVHNL